MIRKDTQEVKFLNKKQLQKLFKTIESTKDSNKYYLRDLTIFNLAYYCGLRISEIGLIRRENYNKSTKEIYISKDSNEVGTPQSSWIKKEKVFGINIGENMT